MLPETACGVTSLPQLKGMPEAIRCCRLQVTAMKEGRIRKPVVAWVSGTCAKLFKSEVQFGHAGAKSGGQAESAQVTLRFARGNLQLACGRLRRVGRCGD